jgi:hypothetical protein
MEKTEIQWPPHVGDRVQLVQTGAPGQIVHIAPIGDNRPFVVAIFSRELGKATTAPHRAYMLRDLAPESAPPIVVVAAPAAAPRRRAARIQAAE